MKKLLDAARSAPWHTEALRAAFVVFASPVLVHCSGGAKATTTASDGGDGSSTLHPLDARASDGRADAGRTGRDGGSDAAPDAPRDTDAATTAAGCPATPCGPGEACCVDPTNHTMACATSCAVADTLSCLQPSDCSGSTPICCATEVRDGGTPPHCTAASVSSRCTTAASCPSTIALNCTTPAVVPLCATGADCAAGTKCCQLPVSGHPFHACINSSIASIGTLTCD